MNLQSNRLCAASDVRDDYIPVDKCTFFKHFQLLGCAVKGEESYSSVLLAGQVSSMTIYMRVSQILFLEPTFEKTKLLRTHSYSLALTQHERF